MAFVSWASWQAFRQRCALLGQGAYGVRAFWPCSTTSYGTDYDTVGSLDHAKLPKSQVWYCEVKLISHALMHAGSRLTRTIVWFSDPNFFCFAIMWLLCFSLALEVAEVRWWWSGWSIPCECSLFSLFVLFNRFWVPYNPNPPLLHLVVFLSLSPTLLSAKCRSFPDMFLMDGKRSKASGDHQEILCQEICGNNLDRKKSGFLIVFFSFCPPAPGISLWKNALTVHLFISQEIMG